MKMLTKDHLKRPSAYDCLLMIPKKEKEKYEITKSKNLNELLFEMFMASIGLGYMPPEMEEEFNDLFLIISEFPEMIERNFSCKIKEKKNNKTTINDEKNEEEIECQKIPLIKINYNNLEVTSQCESGHLKKLNIKDFYRIFSDQRNQNNSNI